MDSITLSELTTRIQEVIRINFSTPVWIKAEISELRENAGHCYLEFIEKDGRSDAIIAKSRATIWNSTYRMLKPYFENSTGQSLRAGLNVLVAVTVEFHDVFGFSLNVRDIEPAYTIGELAARRLKVIRQLEADGVLEMNKQLTIPVLPQRIAVISSESAAGYGDFCDQLANSSQFVFYHKLFPAIMQGEKAEASIIGALERVFVHAALFDVVVIIRGGGATTDLACFDSYDLALNCTQFPLPIIAGIGHQRDVSILDMVAHTSVKTPTAAAELLISRMQDAEYAVSEVLRQIGNVLQGKMEQERRFVEQVKLRIRQTFSNKVMQRRHLLEMQQRRLRSGLQIVLMREKNRLDKVEKNIETYSPQFLLKHGYTITTVNGEKVLSTTQLQAGDILRTYTVDGEFESTVTSINKHHNNTSE